PPQVLEAQGAMGGSRQAGPVQPAYRSDQLMDTLRGTGGSPGNRPPGSPPELADAYARARDEIRNGYVFDRSQQDTSIRGERPPSKPKCTGLPGTADRPGRIPVPSAKLRCFWLIRLGATERMARPVRKGDCGPALVSLHQRIRSRVVSPAKMEIRAA